MALKKQEVSEIDSLSTQKAKHVFAAGREKEKKVLTTFSIEPSFKTELEDLFSELGLGWAAGIRFALKEFAKKYSNTNN